MRLLLLTTLTLMLLTPARAFAVCLQAEQSQIVEGTLSEGTFKDAADQPEQAFILTPLVPTCLAGDSNIDATEQVSTIHIYSSDDAVVQSIKSLVGHVVFVQGTPFGAHTAHHHAPIVMDITGILAN